MRISAKILATANIEHTDPDGYQTENGEVCRYFSGVYTIAEVEMVLAEMKALQTHIAHCQAFGVPIPCVHCGRATEGNYANDDGEVCDACILQCPHLNNALRAQFRDAEAYRWAHQCFRRNEGRGGASYAHVERTRGELWDTQSALAVARFYAQVFERDVVVLDDDSTFAPGGCDVQELFELQTAHFSTLRRAFMFAPNDDGLASALVVAAVYAVGFA